MFKERVLTIIAKKCLVRPEADIKALLMSIKNVFPSKYVIIEDKESFYNAIESLN